jgi:hypothetical protein
MNAIGLRCRVGDTVKTVTPRGSACSTRRTIVRFDEQQHDLVTEHFRPMLKLGSRGDHRGVARLHRDELSSRKRITSVPLTT